MTKNIWLRRLALALGGASLVAALGLTTNPTRHSDPHEDALDPVRLVTGVDDAKVEWELDGVYDVAITSELFHHDLKDHEGRVVASNAVVRITDRDAAFTDQAVAVPTPKADLVARALPKGAAQDALVAERIVVTANIAHGDPEHPFTTMARRYYRLQGGELRAISSKDFNAIVDPVEVHLSPDGHSYRYQRGRVEFDPTIVPGADRGFDLRIEGAKPVRDSRMHGRRPDGVRDVQSKEDLES